MRRLAIALMLVASAAWGQDRADPRVFFNALWTIADASKYDFYTFGADWSTNSNNGVVTGGVTSVGSGPLPGYRAAAFDGTGYVQINTPLLPSTSDFTVEFWANIPAETGGNVNTAISQGNNSSVTPFNFQMSSTLGTASNQIRLFAHGGEALVGPDIRGAGWVHIALTKTNAVDFTLYIDGSFAASGSRSGDLGSPTGSWIMRIGFRSDNFDHDKFEGIISDMRIWNYARTNTEIYNYHQRRLSGTEDGLVGYWPLAGESL